MQKGKKLIIIILIKQVLFLAKKSITPSTNCWQAGVTIISIHELPLCPTKDYHQKTHYYVYVLTLSKIGDYYPIPMRRTTPAPT